MDANAARERRRPPRLRAGDTVAVVAPAGPVSRELLDAGVATLRSWGLDVVLGDHVLDRHPRLPHLAGADADRAADLVTAWLDPDVAAVLCARGGYGSLRTLERLDGDTLAALAAAPPTILAGSSDVTALHAVLGARCDVVTLFSPMVATTAFAANAEHLRATLFEPATTTVLRGPSAGALVGGRARGVTVGGNLSLLVSGVGAVPAPPPGSIALIEDVTEAPYRVDHFLTHLLRVGWFDGVAGIALGSWEQCGSPDDVRAVCHDRLAPLGVPVVWEHGFGHGPRQLTVPLGVTADLDADTGTLTLPEPALT